MAAKRKISETLMAKSSSSKIQQESSKKLLLANSADLDVLRREAAPSIMEFKFNKKRVKVISKAAEFPEWGTGVIYWPFRDQRLHDNWALLYAQKLAIKNKVPLHVCFCRLTKFMDATIRHFDFMFKGLQELESQCKDKNIEFHFLYGCGCDVLPSFVEKHKIGAVVVDFFPLRNHTSWVKTLSESLRTDVPLIQVDAHNIVPCWIASDKKEYAARTIRNKINSKLEEYLTEFPPVIEHPFTGGLKADPVDWDEVGKTLQVDRSVKAVEWARGGYTGGMNMLSEFIEKKLKYFATLRNDPTKDVLSNVSPWLHFGMISAQRCVLLVKKHSSKHKDSVAAFCEEIIIRRELSDNFCYYNENYDNINGAENWARITLNAHRKDKRAHLYTKDEFECAKTHDHLWNAAQKQLRAEGKMHGFLRMYWAKKILEWASTPEDALSIAIYLNDKYSLDGRDPNGFVGCMWSICGTHDQGWREREIFGKIRYMNYEGCKRKFDVDAFVSKYK